MLDAAREAMAFAAGRSRQHLDRDRMLALALLKCIEIVGEAAGQTSQGFQKSHPQVPWADMIGMRNRLVHGYFDIDLDRVWDTVTDDLPPLVGQLQSILEEEESG